MNSFRKSNHTCKFFGREITLSLICFLLLSSFIVAPALACTGAERQKTLQIVHDSLEIGWKIGMSGNIQAFLPQLDEISKRAQNLSPSCQSLLKQISENFQNVYNPSSTNCVGGVCCDGTGCY